MNRSHKLGRAGMSSLFFGLPVACMGTWLVISAMPAWAQSTSTGTVSGQVTDQQNAAVPGAEVVLLDVATNAPRTTSTNEAGRYSFANVPPGIYDISVSNPGFAQARVTGQKVTVGLVLTVNVTLKVGSVSETVRVTASPGAELQRTNATIGSTITGKALEFLTNLGRDANALFVLQPAVAPGGQVAGAVQDQNTYQLDGGNNTNDMDGSMNVYTPSFAGDPSGVSGGGPTGVMPTPADSVEEFKVNTTNQTADFNSSAGAEVQVVTKRGTNAWHGNGGSKLCAAPA